jgi:hypothetical protein
MTAPGALLAGLLLAALLAVPPFIGDYHVYLLSLTLLWGLFALRGHFGIMAEWLT